jgi:hypothetical protein
VLQLGADKSKRPWGPEQATGAPDTPDAGDHQTAWASRTEDEQDEWLQLEYAQPVTPVAILVFETYNPGAVRRITVSGGPNSPAVTWEVKDPTPVGSEKGVSIFAVPNTVQFKVKSVKLQIDSRRVPGWNEIDAVGLLDTAGHIQWAASATASSFYGDESSGITVEPPLRADRTSSSTSAWTGVAKRRDPNVTLETEQRIDRLEKEISEMKDILQEMRNMMRQKQPAKNAPAK